MNRTVKTTLGGLLSAGALALTGCASTDTKTLHTAAPKPAYNAGAYVLVPSGDSALLRALKQQLATRGWAFTPYTADMTRGIDDYRAMAQRARYRLTLQAEEIGACDTGQPSYRYRVALIENASGKVPITLSGADCLNVIDEGFDTALRQDQIAPRPAS